MSMHARGGVCSSTQGKSKEHIDTDISGEVWIWNCELRNDTPKT